MDRGDVAEMLRAALVQPEKLLELFTAIEPQLYRYPAIDAARFRKAVESAVALQ
jgi:hypothetical protein